MPATSSGVSWKPDIKVGGVSKTEDEPHDGPTHDFSVDYTSGIVAFSSAPTSGVEIRASYHYVPDSGGSIHCFGPPAGKKWTIEKAEAQFSKDLVINDTLMTQPFLTALEIPVPGMPASEYPTAGSYLDFTYGSHPIVPAFGGATRGLQQDTIIMRWEYQSAMVFRHSDGVALKLWLKDDIPFSGERASLTVYALEEDE